jgi:hypothetical protein
MRLTVLTAVAALALTRPAAAQVVVNQTDTFEAGAAGWQNGAGTATVQTGGPAGPADHFLQIATNGFPSGPGSQMVAFNQTQWVGDYTAAGVGAVAMDLRNPGYAPGYSVRVALRTGTLGAGTPAWVSDPFPVPADNAWHHAVFALNETNFTAVNNPPPFAAVLSGGNAEFRILHNPAAAATGAATNPAAALLGIDNIGAVAVPEPASTALIALAAIAASLRRDRRRHGPGVKRGSERPGRPRPASAERTRLH